VRSRIKEKLFVVLTPEEQSKFDLDMALKRINNAMCREPRAGFAKIRPSSIAPGNQFHKIIFPICGPVQPIWGEPLDLRSELVPHLAIPMNSGRCRPNEKPLKRHRL
jgi:hypothetical protein